MARPGTAGKSAPQRIWSRLFGDAGRQTCNYCGRASTEREREAFQQHLDSPGDGLGDVCPHCIRVNAFGAVDRWRMKP